LNVVLSEHDFDSHHNFGSQIWS